MRTLLLFVLLLSSTPSWSAAPQQPLLVITSQRNAETVAEAARLLQQQYPDLTLLARSDTQLWAMTPQQQQQLLDASSGLLGLGLFGATVAELEARLRHYHQPVVILNSDHRLMQLSRLRGRPLFDSAEQLRTIAGIQPSQDFEQSLEALQVQYPQQAEWIAARRYWQAGGSANTAQLLAWFYRQLGAEVAVQPAEPLPRLRWVHADNYSTALPDLPNAPLVAVLDHAGGDRPADAALLRDLCATIEQQGFTCLGALAFWGEAGVEAVRQLKSLQSSLSAVVMLQDFVIGAGEGREAVTEALTELDVPLLKAIKLRDRTELERQLSGDGLARDKVYYQVAMPELQGASQPLVVAAAGRERDDARTGIRIRPIAAVAEGLNALGQRLGRWHALQHKANGDKRLAIIYYNHPPGRHNIGADNLDVPASLFQILTRLRDAGYHTGTLPDSPEALLDLLQQRGINLPNNADQLARMSPLIARMSGDRYARWFAGLPEAVRQEMQAGPFGRLHAQLRTAAEAGEIDLARDNLEHTLEEMHHLLEGVDHPGRERALSLLDELEVRYGKALAAPAADTWKRALSVVDALRHTGIEGLGGWGEAPGEVMTHQGELLLPGLQFGNIFIGPQPPRGWEINEELLHANLAFPPPHQYLAFYHYLRDEFRADALIHLGRHSTYEFLPHRSVGLAADDYARIVAGDLPGIYPYIVDGVGEGIQAKRRGLAVMVDHLTPPLQSTPLYDQLLQLRQLIESFEASHGSGNDAMATRQVAEIRARVEALELKQELAEAMAAELAVMGIGFDEVDDDMLVHEVGHYLTDLQERFMPLGLHVFGRAWEMPAVELMLDSMGPADAAERHNWQGLLQQSPGAEMAALLRGLDGGYIAPGQGNDPIRSPTSLPTGRNFYALDNSLVPSPVAWELGRQLAADARANNPRGEGKREAVVLWASDVVRDEGVMIAFGLDMLGLQPVWNSRGLVKGLEHQALEADRERRDVLFTTSGLFRDLYSQQMALLSDAVLMAIDASADRIRRDYPALNLALGHTLAPLGERARGGAESLHNNRVAAAWVSQARQLLADGLAPELAGVQASLRVFGDAPGSYGAGINRLTERSGAWQQRSELAEVYLRRLGHSYTAEQFGAASQATFRRLLGDVQNTYFGRSSNLYGLIDNNDAFDYLGGLSLAVESISGRAPNNFVINHADPERVTTQPLATALRQELRGRFLNPAWLEPLMQHGYAGARTMGSEFLEYLWGWQVTNPTLVGDWAWEEVKSVYLDDRYDLQLDEFLQQGHNAHVKSNMLAIMLVAIHKEFWNADPATTADLAQQFADLVIANGLPGSGHTDPHHPMLPWLQQHLAAETWQQLQQRIADATREATASDEIHRLSEVQLREEPVPDSNAAAATATTAGKRADPAQTATSDTANPALDHWHWLLGGLLLLVVGSGFATNLRPGRTTP